MPLMDLTTPVELYAVEVLHDSTGRAQAYFTFLNCAVETLCSLYATITLLDDGGTGVGTFPLRCDGLQAVGHSRFTVCRAVDDMPAFSGARALVREAAFADGARWHIDESAVLDCTPPALTPGPDRIALIAVAGPDAVCFPQRRGNVWVCVCGRFNRMEWSACRRCQRGRDDTLARFTPERTHEAYEQKLEQELTAARAHRAIKRTSLERAEAQARSDRIDVELRRQRRRRLALALVMLLIVAVAALLVAMPYLYESPAGFSDFFNMAPASPSPVPTLLPSPIPTASPIPTVSPAPPPIVPTEAPARVLIDISTQPPASTAPPALPEGEHTAQDTPGPTATASPTPVPLKTGSAFG